MQLGMIGLGRMGGNIVRRLMKHGHTTVVYDKDPNAVALIAAAGAVGASTLEEFVKKLEKPRTAWVMLPAGKITEATINALCRSQWATPPTTSTRSRHTSRPRTRTKVLPGRLRLFCGTTRAKPRRARVLRSRA